MDGFYPLNQVETRIIKELYKRSKNAILVISISHLVTLILVLVTLATSPARYVFFAALIPLVMYLWLMIFAGKKYVNNYYSFKRMPEGIVLHKKEVQNYSAYSWMWILIFYVSSIVRLFKEIANLKAMKKELSARQNET